MNQLIERIKSEVGLRAYQTAKPMGAETTLLDYLEKYDPTTDSLEHLYVEEQVKNFELKQQEIKGIVLIPLVQSRSTLFRQCIFAHAFHTRGYKPIVLRCHTDLELCHRKKLNNSDELRCGLCKRHGEKLLRKFGYQPTPIGELIKENQTNDNFDLLDIEKYRDIRVKQFVVSSSRAYLKKYHIDMDNERERKVYESFMMSALLLVDAAYEIFKNYDIDIVIGLDQAYIYDGIFLAVANKMGITAVGENPGRMPETHTFGYEENKSSLAWFTNLKFIRRELQQGLTQSQEAKIDNIMSDRKSGQNTRFDYLAHAETRLESKSHRTAGLFTNLMWDSSLSVGSGVYQDPFVWVEDTIKYASDIDNLELVIKTHPLENRKNTNEKMIDWIQERYDPLPQNITLLPPDTEVSPYELMDTLDFGIVFNSTVGFEMTYEGIPVIVTGETHYRDLDFTFDPETVDEYLCLIDELDSQSMTETMHKRAKRYAYFFFVRKHIEFPYPRHFSEDEPAVVRHEDIKPGNENFDIIVDKILSEEPVCYPE